MKWVCKVNVTVGLDEPCPAVKAWLDGTKAKPYCAIEAEEEESVDFVTNTPTKVGTFNVTQAAKDYAAAMREETDLNNQIKTLNEKRTVAASNKQQAAQTLSTARQADPSGTLVVDLGEGEVLFWASGMVVAQVGKIRKQE